MGLQKHKKKYFFIPDDIIELQMFQGCQNWSWISQGVLGSNFIALPGIPGGWAIQLYMYIQHTFIHSYMTYMTYIHHTYVHTTYIHMSI